METHHLPSPRAVTGRPRTACRAARASGALATLLSAVLALTACGGSDAGHPAAAAPASHGPTTVVAPQPARIRLTVADGMADASIRTAADVSATGGRLTDVSVIAPSGRRVAGTLSADGRSWRPKADLSPGTAYRLTARATSGGRVTSSAASFSTLATSHRLTGTYTPENGSTVGVGMPVSFMFDKPVSDRKAVAAGITITSSSRQRVVGHWFGSQRVDFRPERYWQAGSAVSVRIRLDGVKGAPHAYGYQDKTVRFTVGRSQVSKVDVRTHTMNVVRDGHLVRTLPITSGAPGKTTYNGRMVISEKLTQTRMDGATVGYAGQYDIPDVPHAMRLSNSGTFIHGNYWAADSVFGHQDVSHGCVGLDDVRGGGDPGQDASWFFHHSLIGDVVVVEHSHDRTISPDNGLNGWNMPWSEWTEASA